MTDSRRIFDYDRQLLPNHHLAALEPAGTSIKPGDGIVQALGYPGWNLLYYSLFCSIEPEKSDAVVIETGTNEGTSSIVMAQAIKDLGLRSILQTVDVNPNLVEKAKRNVHSAGLSDHVEFHVENALTFLSRMADEHDRFDFVFIDDLHETDHVVKELEIVAPKVARGGKLFVDNTSGDGLPEALAFLKNKYGGNLLDFQNSSWLPPGNAIWQPD